MTLPIVTFYDQSIFSLQFHRCEKYKCYLEAEFFESRLLIHAWTDGVPYK